MNLKVDEFISKAKKWQEEVETLRTLLLDCHLTEELKWGTPCYTFQNSNIVLIHTFKEYCALGFFNGALLSDTEGIMVKPDENTQSGRQIRFTSKVEITKMEPILKAYLFEAIEVEKVGLKAEVKKSIKLVFPDELLNKFESNATFKTAFESLTPGRQRAYVIYFSDSKQSKTREARIEKYTQQILNGKGFNDCTCGLSQKMPSCDGSHKLLRKVDQL